LGIGYGRTCKKCTRKNGHPAPGGRKSEADVFDRFMAACEKAAPPNAALKRAAELARERGIE